ncbi:unnamed protein product [Arabidopsis halleri]
MLDKRLHNFIFLKRFIILTPQTLRFMKNFVYDTFWLIKKFILFIFCYSSCFRFPGDDFF